MNPAVAANRRYFWELGLAMGLYMVVLFSALTLVNGKHVSGGLEYAVLLAPVVPVALVFASVVRWLRSADELERQITLEALAVAAGITALLSVTYGFLEIAGLPHLSAWFTWCVLMGSWGIAKPFVARTYR